MDTKVITSNLQKTTRLLKAMANEKRLLVLCALLEGEKCVGELEALVGLRQSALSQHLARLRRDDIVTTRRSAQTIYYSIRNDEVGKVIGALSKYCCPQELLP